MQRQIQQITNIKDAIPNPRRGDCICFDIDELSSLSQDQQKDLINYLNWLKEIGILVVGVGNDISSLNSSSELIEKINNLMHIIPKTSEESKQQALINHINALSNHDKPKRIHVINNTDESLQALSQATHNQAFPKVLLYHFDSLQHQQITEAPQVPDSLEKYDTIKSLGGGTASTYKITSSKDPSLPPLVLKYGASQDAIKVEILCNEIYRTLGVNIPQSKVFNTLPTALAKKLNQSSYGIFQVSEFIAGKEIENEQTIIDSSVKNFAVHALLGNIDITKSDNYIEDKNNNIFLIDTGSNFIFRALGEFRPENNKVVTEVDSLRTIDEEKQKWFGDLTDSQIKEQVISLLEKESELEKLVWEISQKLQIPDSLRMDFLQFLSERLDYLALRFCPEIPRYAKADRAVEEKQNAAGILTYAIKDNEPMVLLAKRIDHAGHGKGVTVGLWDCFGGGADAMDPFLHTTAAREVYEESSQMLTHAPGALLNCPFHDIITEKNGKPFL